MKTKLSENIRAFRKEKGLTQEQLAEVFGVTVGAVHKWENGLTTPELSLILEMADFFDLSLDVMIGFEPKDNGVQDSIKRIRLLTASHDHEGVIEAEKALKKYPHNFDIVYHCAQYYLSIGSFLTSKKKYLKRSKELYYQAIRLLPQNKDPYVDEAVLYGTLAWSLYCLEETDTAIQTLKDHNAAGMHNIPLGLFLAQQNKTEEADIVLSYAFIQQMGNLLNLLVAKGLTFTQNHQYKDARDLFTWGLMTNRAMRKDGKTCFLDKSSCIFLTGLAWAELKLKDKKKAKEHLQEAIRTAEAFDAAPNYDATNMRFISLKDRVEVTENSGETARQSIENVIRALHDPEMDQLWKSQTK